MKYSTVEIRAGYLDGRTSVARRLKDANAIVRQHDANSPTFITMSTDDRDLVNAVLAYPHARQVIIRNLDAELTEALTHGGHVQAWAVVYKEIPTIDGLDIEVERMIEKVAKREAAVAEFRALRKAANKPTKGSE